jgi:hypothetical protein
MTTKRKLERLAQKLLGKDATTLDYESADTFEAASRDGTRYVSVCDPNAKERRKMLAEALRGIIAWQESKK